MRQPTTLHDYHFLQKEPEVWPIELALTKWPLSFPSYTQFLKMQIEVMSMAKSIARLAHADFSILLAS